MIKDEMNIYEATIQEYVIREETLNGRQYIVVPVTMMMEGVHTGSHGALLHTAEELGKIPESWNGIPVTVGHPVIDGQPVSANSPSILEAWCIGIVFNTIMNDNRLKSEAWLEKTKLQNHENLNDRIANGEIIEVSVGVFSEDEIVEGKWHNESYVAVARNLRPDHLAILPNLTGACSVEDGCGIRTNSKNMKNEEALKQVKQLGYVISQLAVNQSLLALVEKVRSFVYQMDNDTAWYYVEDIEENSVIYSKSGKDIDSKLYKHGYAITADGNVTFVGEPIEVKRKVEYETVQTNEDTGINKSKITNFKKEDQNMSDNKCTPCVAKKAGELIANKAVNFVETDREWLETLEEAQLDRMVPKTVEPTVVEKQMPITPEMAVNALKSGLKGEEDFIALMPTNMQEQMRSALKLHSDHKLSLVDGILANTDEGVWTKEELNAYEVGKLEKIAKTAGVRTNDVQANYSGMGAGSNIRTNAQEEVPPMAPAGITFN